jgi:hypothetical protein
MSGLGQRLKNEVRELIPVTLFFFVAFQLLALTHALMLHQYGIKVYSFINVTILAMVVAKVVLIADHVKFVNRFPDKPLVYNVVWKTGIYFFASFAVRYVEHLIHFWRQSESFGEANRRLYDAIVWPHFWGVQVWLLVLLLVYCSVRELARAVGPGRLLKMFFSDPRRADDEG